MEKEMPLSIAISALIKDGKILLIKRKKGDYVDLWSLPGGKIEKQEHLENASKREILEETGINTGFVKFNGVVSEHLVEANKIIEHFLLHICTLKPLSQEIKNSDEGELAWFDLDKLEEIKDKIIPSDFYIIEKMIKDNKKNYFNCIIEKQGNEYFLRLFE